MVLELNEDQRLKLLNLCVRYFPKTKMLYYIEVEGHKEHCVYFKKEDEDGFSTWSSENNNIPKSPYIILGFNQTESTDEVEYEHKIEMHWYDLVMGELSDRIYKLQYENRIKLLLESNMHPVDFIHKDYLEECDVTFF